MNQFSLIYLCGGIGQRADVGQPKQFYVLNGTAMLIYGLMAVNKIAEIDEIVINYPEGFLPDLKHLVEAYGIAKRIIYVPAGKTRQESVAAMVEQCTNDNVLIHEAARPIVTDADFRELIECDYENVSFVEEIPFTVAVVDPEKEQISQWLDRSTLRNIQLPQKFSRSILSTSHKKAAQKDVEYTEDATMCLECSGEKVHFIDGRSTNIKVTTQDQFIIADLFLSGRKTNV